MEWDILRSAQWNSHKLDEQFKQYLSENDWTNTSGMKWHSQNIPNTLVYRKGTGSVILMYDSSYAGLNIHISDIKGTNTIDEIIKSNPFLLDQSNGHHHFERNISS